MKQSDLFARQLRDEGMSRAVTHADRVVEDWGELARGHVMRFLAWSEPVNQFTTEDVRDWIGACVPEPPDRRAWGAVMMKVARTGLIVRVGYRKHRDPSRHCGVSTVWRKV